nr:CPBP family intramembrane glutamic endopeptidase [Haloarchaeobius salinus]
MLAALDLVPGSVIEESGTIDPNFFLGVAVLSVLIVAPAEEYLFRGVVQGRLRETFGPVGAVVGSSLLFGSVHLANYTGSVEQVVAGALLIAGTGAVLGALYEWTDNLTVPIVTHALYNVVLAGTAYVTATAA